MAGVIAERIEAAQASGQLTVHAGRVQSFQESADAATVLFRRRGTTEIKAVRVVRTINCSGFGADYDRIGHRSSANCLSVARPGRMSCVSDLT